VARIWAPPRTQAIPRRKLNGFNTSQRHSGMAVSPYLASPRMSEKWALVFFTMVFLFSSGVAAPSSAPVGLYQIPHEGLSGIAPPQGTPPQGGSFFFDAVVGGGSTVPGSDPAASSAMQAAWPGGLPQALSAQVSGGADSIFVREGNAYLVLTQGGGNDGSAPFMQSSALPKVWLDSDRRRSRFRIHVEILEALKSGALTPFEISFRLRLNTKRTKAYLELLADNGLLERSIDDGRDVYVLTAKGWEFSENVRSAMILDS
jgi:predicted transcriptional regulator